MKLKTPVSSCASQWDRKSHQYSLHPKKTPPAIPIVCREYLCIAHLKSNAEEEKSISKEIREKKNQEAETARLERIEKKRFRKEAFIGYIESKADQAEERKKSFKSKTNPPRKPREEEKIRQINSSSRFIYAQELHSNMVGRSETKPSSQFDA